MFVSKDGNKIPLNQKVQVYFNLNKRDGKWYSIKYKGRVQGYSECITLQDVRFKVNEKGVERIRHNRRKEVCGVVEGILISVDEISLDGYKEVNFDPYKTIYFYYVDTGEPIYKCEEAICFGKRVWVK